MKTVCGDYFTLSTQQQKIYHDNRNRWSKLFDIKRANINYTAETRPDSFKRKQLETTEMKILRKIIRKTSVDRDRKKH